MMNHTGEVLTGANFWSDLLQKKKLGQIRTSIFPPGQDPKNRNFEISPWGDRINTLGKTVKAESERISASRERGIEQNRLDIDFEDMAEIPPDTI